MFKKTNIDFFFEALFWHSLWSLILRNKNEESGSFFLKFTQPFSIRLNLNSDKAL